MTTDRDQIWEFIHRFQELAAGATTIGLLSVADRTGLLRFLAGSSSVTPDEAASGAGLNPRYVEEILFGLAAAGVIEHEGDRFTLPTATAEVIASDDSPYSMVGWLDMIPAAMARVGDVADATQQGGGVPFELFGPDMIRGIDRANSPSQRILLARRWLAAVPGLIERLESGGRVADVGCGSGTAAIAIAERFPECEVVGIDVSSPSLERAKERGAGIANLEFMESTVEEMPTEPGFDLVTAFDVIHDLADPLAGLRRIRQSLPPDGLFLMMEPAAGATLEENIGARGALLYGISALHCMTQSLARRGAGLGAAWGPVKAEELAREAGFTSFESLDDISNEFSAFYLVR